MDKEKRKKAIQEIIESLGEKLSEEDREMLLGLMNEKPKTRHTRVCNYVGICNGIVIGDECTSVNSGLKGNGIPKEKSFDFSSVKSVEITGPWEATLQIGTDTVQLKKISCSLFL